MKKIFIVGASLIATGLTTMIVSGIVSGDWKELYGNNEQYTEAEPYVTDAEILSISVYAENREIVLAPSSDGHTTVRYYESEHDAVTITLESGELTVENKVEWLGWFDFGFPFSDDNEAHTVYIDVPVSSGIGFDIDTSNGAVSFTDLPDIGNVDVKTSNGAISFTRVSGSHDLTASTSNGRITVNDVSVSGELYVKTSNGKIGFDDAEAEEITAITTNGTIEGSGVTSDRIDLRSSNGGITFEVIGLTDDYHIDMSTSNGSMYLNGDAVTQGTFNPSKTNSIKARTSNGTIRLSFI